LIWSPGAASLAKVESGVPPRKRARITLSGDPEIEFLRFSNPFLESPVKSIMVTYTCAVAVTVLVCFFHDFLHHDKGGTERSKIRDIVAVEMFFPSFSRELFK
jgi:hypothetical protein